MLSRIALLAFGLLFAGRAIGDDNLPSPLENCRQNTAVMRSIGVHDLFDAPSAVSQMTVNVIDGKLPQVRQQLKAMSPAEATRWRQSALISAAFSGQPAVVDGLLNDGAAVNGKGWMPGYKAAFFERIVEDMKHDPRFGGQKGVASLKASGVLENQGQEIGPALVSATQCDDAATVDVLLRHHADAKFRLRPGGADVLMLAIVHGNAVIVRALLDRGIDVCADDRIAQQSRIEYKKKNPEYKTPGATYAELGRRQKLPDDLVARLTCPGLDSGR